MELQQKSSQRQLYSEELLRLSTLELESYIRELAQENPLVELEETSSVSRTEGEDDRLGRLRWLEDNDRQNWFYQQFSDEELDPLARIGTGGGLEETLVSFLSRQLDRLKLEEGRGRLVRYLIYCLDDDGYLRTPLEELASHGAIPLPELEEARAVLQSLEPAGVGASELSQCLSLQLERIGETGPALVIVREHLEALAEGRDQAISAKLNITPAQVDEARRTIRELDPRPGSVFHKTEQVFYTQPDLVVEEQEGRLTVRPARRDRPLFRMSRYYQKLLEQTEDREVREYLTEKLRQAENVLWAAEQRESTILRCAQVVVERQSGFFRLGPEALHPLGVGEVARELGLSETAVSRAVREKYLQCPKGLYPLSWFFSRSAGAGEGLSGTAARRLLLRLIDGEDKAEPLSDQQLSEGMAREGCPISSQTVTKYREELGIPGASGRKS